MIKSISSIGILLLLIACDTGFPRIDRQQLGQSYYPAFIGFERVFLVDSVVFDVENNLPVSSAASFYWRDIIIDSTITNIGDTLYRMERYRGETENGPWTFEQIVAIIISEDEAIFKENNLNFLELQFPFDESDSWDAAQYIDGTLDLIVNGELLEDVFQNWESRVLNTDETFTFNQMDVEQVAMTEVSDSNAVTLRSRRNYFAPGLGLVKQETRILNSICKHELSGQTQFCAGLSWEEKASRGYILTLQRVR